jgi:ABC-type uncharacterized transport system ATPase subunit
MDVRSCAYRHVMTIRSPIALELQRISKRYGALSALQDASITVRRGSVHALLGENGAGKSTLMRIAYGIVRADSGAMSVAGEACSVRSPSDAIRLGIGMVHQHFSHAPQMTVAENIALGGHGRLRLSATRQSIRQIGREAGLVLDPDMRADLMPVSAQQRLEIVKALVRSSTVLILDEPTAVLAPGEVTELFRFLRQFAEGGGAVIIITHKLRDALSVSDELTILRHGQTVLRAPTAGADASHLLSAMLGRNVSMAEFEQRPRDPSLQSSSVSAPVLQAMRVSIRDEKQVVRVRPFDLEILAGEILGVVGVEGAGQRELLRGFAGRIPVEGLLRLPRAIAFIPEDRQRDALILAMRLYENVALANAASFRGRVPWKAIRRQSVSILEEADVRAASIDAIAGSLSGGNQQKLVIARELRRKPALIVAENPTRGLDVAASAGVLNSMRAAAKSGAAVVIYSSDLDEVLEMSDRVVVMHAGEATFHPPNRERVGRAMLGLPL